MTLERIPLLRGVRGVFLNIFSCLILITLPFLHAQSQTKTFIYQKVEVAAGPEDFVLDTLGKNQRLILACQDRRDKNAVGDFYSLQLSNHQVKKMIRKNEPEGFYIMAHGMDLEYLNNNCFLYAVSHHKRGDMVVKYKVIGDTLYFIRTYEDKLISKINDIAVFKGSIAMTNFYILRGNIVLFDSLGKGRKIIKGLHYPNGVYIHNDSTMYYTSSVNNTLVKCTGNFFTETLKETVVAKLHCPDNILRVGPNLYTTGHASSWKLYKNLKNEKNKSPFSIYQYNMEKNALSLLFENDGSIMNAASSAAVYKEKLYISPIFENYILVVPFKKAGEELGHD